METTLRAVAYSARFVSVRAWRMADRYHASRAKAAELTLVAVAMILFALYERSSSHNER